MNVRMSRLRMTVTREAATPHSSVYSRARGLNTVPPLSEETPSDLGCSLVMKSEKASLESLQSTLIPPLVGAELL